MQWFRIKICKESNKRQKRKLLKVVNSHVSQKKKKKMKGKLLSIRYAH